MKTSVLNKFLSSYYAEETLPAIVKRVDLFGSCHYSIDKSLCLVAYLNDSGSGKHTFLDLVLVYADGDYQFIHRFSNSDSFDSCMYTFKLALCQMIS